MEYIPQIISIAIGLVILYLTAYLKKRADNIATKRDIEEITEKIETVKAKLQIDTKGAIDFKTNRRQTLLEFYDAFVYWYDIVLDLTNSNLDEDHLKEIKDYDKKIDEAYSDQIIKHRRLNLYIPDDHELLNLTEEMISLGIKIEGLVRRFIGKIYFDYEKLSEYYAYLDSGVNVQQNALDAVNMRISELEKDLASNEEIIRLENDKNIMSFIKLSQKYIRIDL